MYAGVTQILYYERSSTSLLSINGGWNTPLHGDPSQIPKVHTAGNDGASVLVPGFITGVVDAAQKFAKFPLENLFELALFFAKNGFKMSAGLANSQYVTNLLDSKMNPREAMASPTFLLPSFSDFFQYVPSVDDKVLQEMRNMGQGVTEVDYLTAYGPIVLGVALTIDDNVR